MQPTSPSHAPEPGKTQVQTAHDVLPGLPASGGRLVSLTEGQSELLGFLRGLAAVTVVIAHGVQIFLYRKIGHETGFGFYSGNAATLAVMFFFVISGFFITTSILRNHARNGRFDAGQFVRSRLLRLYPPLMFSLAVCAAVHLIVSGFGLHGSLSYRFPEDLAPAAVARERVEFSWSQTVASLTFTARVFWSEVPVLNGPLWSLMYEFWYYCLALCFAGAAFNRSWVAALAGASLFIALWHAADPLAFRLCGIWASGAALAIAFHQGLPPPWRLSIRTAGIGGLCYLLLTQATRFDSDRAKYAWTFVFVAALAVMLRRAKWTSSVLPAFAWLNIGRSSYTLYVLHFPLLLLGYSLWGPMLRYADFDKVAAVASAWMALILLTAIGCSRFLEPQNQTQNPG